VDELDLNPAAGFVEASVRDEFPGLALDWIDLEARIGDSSEGVVRRLHQLSNRFRGADVVAMRTKPIPHAYRSFYRQIGLDPDTTRTPIEAAAVDRLMHGQFRSLGMVADALLIGLIETGVPLWALDAAHVDAGGLGIRTTVAGDTVGIGERIHYLAPGRLAVADASQIHALLFDPLASDQEPGPLTQRIILFAVSVPGVPRIHVEEAFWLACEVLRSG
jgi:DNA/RNA-binding domain of Phe-tRNA-synthetase-like protein